MDADMRDAFNGVYKRIDELKENLKETCKLRHETIDVHLEDSPQFRDKLMSLGTKSNLMWSLLLLMISGCLGGFFWLLRTKG